MDEYISDEKETPIPYYSTPMGPRQLAEKVADFMVMKTMSPPDMKILR